MGTLRRARAVPSVRPSVSQLAFGLLAVPLPQSVSPGIVSRELQMLCRAVTHVTRNSRYGRLRDGLERRAAMEGRVRVAAPLQRKMNSQNPIRPKAVLDLLRYLRQLLRPPAVFRRANHDTKNCPRCIARFLSDSAVRVHRKHCGTMIGFYSASLFLGFLRFRE